MRLGWLKLHTEARNDAKLRTLTAEQFRVWFNLLCLSAESEGDIRGSIPAMDSDVLAIEVANGDTALLESTLVQLAKLRIVEWRDDGALAFTNFKKRQYDNPSDYPEATRERKARSRASHGVSRDVTSKSRRVTAVTPREEKRREDTEKRDPTSSSGEMNIKNGGKDTSAPPRAPSNHFSKNQKPNANAKAGVIAALPQTVTEQFASEQIATEFDKFAKWVKSRDHPPPIDAEHFKDWLLRIPAAQRQKPNETDVERLRRILANFERNKDARCLVDGRTYASWDDEYHAAKDAEAEQRSAERRRIMAARFLTEEAEVVQQNGAHPPATE